MPLGIFAASADTHGQADGARSARVAGIRAGDFGASQVQLLCGCTIVDLDDHSAVLASNESAVGHEMWRDLDEDFLEDACAP